MSNQTLDAQLAISMFNKLDVFSKTSIRYQLGLPLGAIKEEIETAFLRTDNEILNNVLMVEMRLDLNYNSCDWREAITREWNKNDTRN